MWYVARTTILIMGATIFLSGTGLLSACGNSDMPDSDSGALDDSTSFTVAADILNLAASQDEAELMRLSRLLIDEATLLGWDTEFDYDNLDPRSLNLAEVLRVLSENDADAAFRQLIGLTESPLYENKDARILLLIEAMGNLKQIDERAVSYWRKYGAPGSIFTIIVVDATARQGGPEAARVFGEILLDADHRDQDKIAWLRRSLVPHRNQIGLLSEARNWVLDDRLSSEVQAALVEALFDYRPEEWYPPGVAYPPPEQSDFSPEALIIRADLAGILLGGGSFDGQLRQAVRRAAEQ